MDPREGQARARVWPAAPNCPFVSACSTTTRSREALAWQELVAGVELSNSLIRTTSTANETFIPVSAMGLMETSTPHVVFLAGIGAFGSLPTLAGAIFAHAAPAGA